MSNPQDSPKTAGQMLEESHVTLCQITQLLTQGRNGEANDVCRKLLAEWPESYIDAQKAEVTESVVELAEAVKYWSDFSLAGIEHLEGLIATRDQKLAQEAVKPWREALSKAHQALQAIIAGNARLEPVVGSMVLSAAKCFKPRVLGRDDVLQDGDEVRLLGHGPAVYEPVADAHIGRPIGDKAEKFEYRRPLLSHEAWAEAGNRALLSQPLEVK